MKNSFELYIGKKHTDCFDEAKAYADLKGMSLSSIVCRAVEEYMMKLNNKPKILLNKDEWDLSQYNKKELEQLDTLIRDLNRKVIEELCQR